MMQGKTAISMTAHDVAMPAGHQQPLAGKRVLVTRAREQAATMSDQLRAVGAVPIEFPAIRIEPAADYDALDAALRDLQHYDWMVFTSVNTITYVEQRLSRLGLSWRALDTIDVAAIGPKTAGELTARNVSVSYVPDEYVSTAVAFGLPLQPGQRVLLARADLADKRLVDGLRARGARVDEFVAYRTVPGLDGAAGIKAALANGQIDAVTFASSSTVRYLCAALGDGAADLLARSVVACIGPITAAMARDCGLHPRVVAREYTTEGLVAALAEYYG